MFIVDMKRFLLDITGEVDTFVGLIYTTGDLQETVSVMELNPEKFIVFMGTDEVILKVKIYSVRIGSFIKLILGYVGCCCKWFYLHNG